ncbi:MAG: cytochrome b/b6 domain-containing protein [Aestuariivirga sp.]
MKSIRQKVTIHSLSVRVFHWVNAFAIIVMIMSGWRIYNASPLFAFRFPNEITLGGWLAGALQWHFAAMWLLVLNLLVYLLIGLFGGHFRRSFLPVTPASVFRDVGKALRGRLPHETGTYNAVQKASYIGVLAVIVLTILSGACVWKPVQLQSLTALMGGYEGARLVHFAGMTLICAFIVVHLVLVAIVPSTLLPMIRGWARIPREDQHGS